MFSITVASTGRPDLLFKVLAYFPPTAPFCMTVLVGLHQVKWWEFTASALISVAGTVGMAIFAARIYRRAVLRTGGRVKIRANWWPAELRLRSPAHHDGQVGRKREGAQ